MDAVMLARIQFAFTVGYHFIFVPISIGVGMMVVLSESALLQERDPADRAASNFWIKLFTTTFAIGVATGHHDGVRLRHELGQLLALRRQHLRRAARRRGPHRLLPRVDLPRRPAVRPQEGLQALLLRLRLAGLDRRAASRRSGSSSPTRGCRRRPGYEVEGGKAVLTSFWAAAFNPSTAPRYFHTVAAALITGCFVVAGVCAYYMLKKRHLHFARQALMRPPVGLVVSLAMPFLGHWGALVVAEYQPVKMAAFENVGRHAEERAPLPVRLGQRRGRPAGGHRHQHPQRPEPHAGPQPRPRGHRPRQRGAGRQAAGAAHLPELPPHDRPVVPLHPRVRCWRSSCTCSSASRGRAGCSGSSSPASRCPSSPSTWAGWPPRSAASPGSSRA